MHMYIGVCDFAECGQCFGATLHCSYAQRPHEAPTEVRNQESVNNNKNQIHKLTRQCYNRWPKVIHTCLKAISALLVFAVSVAPVPPAIYIGGSYVRLLAAPIKEKQHQAWKENLFLFSFIHIFYHIFCSMLLLYLTFLCFNKFYVCTYE